MTERLFSFWPKPKIAENAVFLFGRNQYRNQKQLSYLAENDTETEIRIYIKSALNQGIIKLNF